MKYCNARKIVLTVIVAAISALLTSASGQQSPRRIDIQAKRFQYTPNEITLKKGEPVVLVFHSEDVTHGFKLKQFNLRTEIPKNGTSEVAFTPDKAGDFVGQCAHFCGSGHGEMKLTIHVTE
jgi:cytochrome c oxidase subunit II